MAVQAFIFGNASALAAAQAPHVAGAATAVPMIWVMIVGIAGSLFSYLVLARRRSDPAADPRSTFLSKSS